MLELHADKSRHDNLGERVVVGPRLMQSASDLFLGWSEQQWARPARSAAQMMAPATIGDFNAGDLKAYGRVWG